MSFLDYLSLAYWFYERPKKQRIERDKAAKYQEGEDALTVAGKESAIQDLRDLETEELQLDKWASNAKSVERLLELGVLMCVSRAACGGCDGGSAIKRDPEKLYEWTFPADNVLQLEKMEKKTGLNGMDGYLLTFLDVPDHIHESHSKRPREFFFVKGLTEADAKAKYKVGNAYIVPASGIDGYVQAMGPRGFADYWVVPNDFIKDAP